MPILSANAALLFPDFDMNSASMSSFSHGEHCLVKAEVRCQRTVRFQPVATEIEFRHSAGMEIDLKSALKRRGMSQQQLADAIDVSKGYISEIASGKKRPSIETLEQILDAIDADIAEIIPTRHVIAVPGYVGAGAEVYLSDPYPKGEGMYKVACPPQITPHGVVAVEVSGDSMEPVFSEGDLLFYTRNGDHGVPSEAIGRKCVAETEDGRVWVKQLKIGTAPGLFNLLSINPSATNMLDVRVKWAAPVRLHMPKEFVKRVE